MKQGSCFARGLAAARSLAVLAFVLLLSACGGGGSSSSTPSGDGSLSVSPSSLNFSAEQNNSMPSSQYIYYSSSNPQTYNIYAGYPKGATVPSWLDVNFSTSYSNALVVSVNTTNLTPGTYSTKIRLVSAKIDDTVIDYKDVTVSYTVTKKTNISASVSSLSFNYKFGDVTLPAAQPVGLAGSSLDWSASADQSWVKLNISSGTTPSTLMVSVDPTGIAVGSYTATLTITNNSYPGDSVQIPVSFTVDANVIQSPSSQLSFSYVNGDPSLPAAQTISLSGSGLSWNASADQSWVKLGAASGVTPSNLQVQVDSTGMAIGSYQATVTVTSNVDPGNVVSVTINLTISRAPLVLSTTSATYSYIYGSSVLPGSASISLTGYQISWTASISDSWAQLNVATGTGDTGLVVSANTAGLAPGTYTAAITFTDNNDSSNTTTLNLTLNISLPTISLSAGSIALGGSDGKDRSSSAESFTINTGTQVYPWTIALDTGSDGNWMVPDTSSGNVSESSSQSINFSADVSVLSGGNYQGTATITVNVNGQLVQKAIPVTLAYESRHVYVDHNGFAFVSTPSISRLSDSITVKDSYGTNSIAWNAVSDQTWLTVTGSGMTGDNLTLTADPASLSTDVIHYANVTISSSDSTIAGPETIRVGLWVGSTDPNARDTLSVTYTHVIADPIRPYVYLNDGGTNIDVYNVYTASYVTTIADAGVSLGDMTVTRDGTILYAVDSNSAIVPVDLDSYTVGTAWTTTGLTPLLIDVTRIKSHDIIISNLGKAYAGNGQAFAATYGISVYIATSLNGNMACGVNSYSAYTLACASLDYVDINGGLQIVNNPVGYGVGGNGTDVALSNDGSKVYVASGAPYSLEVYDTSSLQHLQSLATDAYPNNADVDIADHVYTTSSAWYGPLDFWYYDAGLIPLGSAYLSEYGKAILARQMVVSGDGKRVIAATDYPHLQFVTVQ